MADNYANGYANGYTGSPTPTFPASLSSRRTISPLFSPTPYRWQKYGSEALDFGWDLTSVLETGDAVVLYNITAPAGSSISLPLSAVVSPGVFGFVASGGTMGVWPISLDVTTAQGRELHFSELMWVNAG